MEDEPERFVRDVPGIRPPKADSSPGVFYEQIEPFIPDYLPLDREESQLCGILPGGEGCPRDSLRSSQGVFYEQIGLSTPGYLPLNLEETPDVERSETSGQP